METMVAKTKAKDWNLFFMALPFMLYIILIRYVPIAGWIVGMYDFKPGIPLFENEFIGMKHYISIFKDPDILI